MIQADGELPPSECCDGAGGGSGGGIRIDAGTLSGTGSVTASGGNGFGSFGAGGGGGRVAIYFETLLGFNLAQVTALGGLGAGAADGQDGTVFAQQQPLIASLPTGEQPWALRTNERLAITQEARSPFASTFSSNSATAGSVQMADFGALFEKLRTQLHETQESGTQVPEEHRDEAQREPANRYLAMLAEKADQQVDFDPVYTYDLNGNRVSMTDPTGITTYSYDVLNRLTSITNPSGQTTAFTYDTLGRRTSMTHDNGVVTTYTYNVASQLLSLVHQLGATTINSFTYTYDDVGNRLSKTDNNGTSSYIYDSLNRLVEAMNPLPSNPLESFTYDDVGNRVDSNQNGLSTFNVANQLNEDANFTYGYDSNGNQIQKTDKATLLSTQFEYDAENTLIRVVREDSSVVTYEYDGLGRRIEKDVAGVITGYIYDNEDILLELDGSGTIVARYTHGPGIDEPIIMERDLDSSGAFESTERFFYQADGLGSVTELSDMTGFVSRTYVYDAFGNVVEETGALENPYTYTGREFDVETNLYFYRARYYDATVGRFLQEDAFSGAITAPPSLNRYPYVANNPVNVFDPSGNFVWNFAAAGVGAVIGGVVGGVTASINGQNVWLGAGVGLVAGAGAGLVLGLGSTFALGLVSGFGANVASQIANDLFAGTPVDVDYLSAAASALSGIVAVAATVPVAGTLIGVGVAGLVAGIADLINQGILGLLRQDEDGDIIPFAPAMAGGVCEIMPTARR